MKNLTLVIALFISSSGIAGTNNVSQTGDLSCRELFVEIGQGLFTWSDLPAPVYTRINRFKMAGWEVSPGIKYEDLQFELAKEPRAAWVYDLIHNDRAEFAMGRKTRSRNSILENGFQNIYSTGPIDFRHIKDRIGTESLGIGISEKQYRQIDPIDRAKAGFLAPPINSGLERNALIVQQSGWTDFYYFKKENLRNRTTWITADSLNFFRERRDGWDPLGTWTEGSYRKFLGQDFLPWQEARDLMIVDLLNPKNVISGQTSLEIPPQNPRDLGFLTSGGTKVFSNATSRSYIELQFWGKLSLDDVEAFVFSDEPPTGQFLLELKKHGIRIFERKDKRDNLWNG